MLVHGLAQPASPRAAYPGPVGTQVLGVVAAEVAGEFVEGAADVGAGLFGRVVGGADPDLVEDRPVPRPVEGGDDEVVAARARRRRRPGLAGERGDLVEQRAEAELGETARELVEPGQPPRGLLVVSQR